jgi:serine/threonine-protein kinase
MPIAAGGMAMVWAARLKGTRGFQKIVAVKTMLPNLVEDEQFEKMFLDEASLASKVRHPNAVEIIDLGEQNGVLFLAMEWIDGVPLNQVMKVAKRQGGVPTTVATRIVMQACAGLHAAHELTDGKGKLLGLVHRDISPQNILVTFDGVAKVVDFGVAKATALGEGTTRAGQVKGKIGYMAPEQARGEAIDRRADVFAMGIVLYVLTTGMHPFRKESEGATLFAITGPAPVVPPSKVVPGYPEALESVVLRALAKDRDQRFASASELFKALDKALPPLMRGSDEEVGMFVTGLFGEQRRLSQAALAQALERADRNELSSPSSSNFAESGANGQSGVNVVSSVGVTVRIAPANQTEGASESIFARVAKLPPRVMLASRLGVATLLLIGLVWSTLDKPAEPAAAPSPAPVALVPPPALTNAPPLTNAPADASTTAAPLRTSAAAVASAAPAPSASAATSLGSKPAPLPRVQAPAGGGAGSPKKSWKHDPGF